MSRDIKAGSYSPWGYVEGVTWLGDGLARVTTASHGGIWIRADRRNEIPPYMPRKTWYEEDCEWSIPALSFYEIRSKDGMEENALETLKQYYPEMYEKYTGTVLGEGESYAKDKRIFEERTANAWVAVSACGQWHEDVPEGMVGVIVKLGKDVNTNHSAPQHKLLVPADVYAQRGKERFVVTSLSDYAPWHTAD